MSLRQTTYISLLVLAGVGWFTLHEFTHSNELFPMMERAVKRGRIPGGPVYRSRLTGVKRVDAVINILVQFFWPVVSGQNWDTSLAGAILGTQGISAFTLTVLDGYRRGNSYRIISFTTIYGVLVQLFGFGFVSPIYLLIHLLTVPAGHLTSAESITVPEEYLREIPMSQMLGFYLPTIIMCLPAPGRINFNSKIQAILFWQLFPVWSAILLEVLGRIRAASKSFKTTPASTLSALRSVYRSALLISAGTHIIILGISLSAMFRPDLYGPRRVLSLLPSHLYLPPNPIVMERTAGTIDRGAFWFLQWDTTCTTLAYLVWAACIKYETFQNTSVATMVKDVLVRPILFGPASAALLMIWERDELLLGRSQKSVAKKLT